MSADDIKVLTENYNYFDRELAQDPFPFYEKVRSECPVFHSNNLGGYWVVTKYDDLAEVNRDWKRYSSAVNGALIPPTEFRVPPFEADPPLHGEWRRLLNPFFSPQRVAELEDEVRKTSNELIDGFIGEGHADLSKQYTTPMPGMVLFGRIIGVPLSDLPYVQSLVDESMDCYDDREKHAALEKERSDYIAKFVAERASRTERTNDIVDMLLHAEVDGEPIGPEGTFKVVHLLIGAGLETTASGLSSSLYYLAQHHDVRDHLAAHPDEIPTAVEEFLRYYSPVAGLGRTVTEDVDVNGQTMHTGDRVLMCWASANRDEEEFPHADEWQLGRVPNRHVAFGLGVHRCLGSHLARLELRVGIEELLRRIPDFDLAGDVHWRGGPTRGLATLPVRFAPRQP